MSGSETFYRVHWADCPEFRADNAWSALWGPERSEDGAKSRCLNCADGVVLGTVNDECTNCDGTGWEDALYGYSCCYTAEGLMAYMDVRGIVSANDTVIVFEGTRVGNGFDGEPLAVPTRVIETLTWAELRGRRVYQPDADGNPAGEPVVDGR